jgi:NifU-like protein involved in Fe-S cluster formation
MADDDLMALYSRKLLALAADIPHLGRLPAPTGSATRRSPQCGSTVTAHVVVADGVVTEFAQEVRACALGQASAAVLGGAVIGRTPVELAAGRDALRAMLTEGDPAPEGVFAAAEALTPARDFPNRHASILLAWEAAAEAAGA